MVNPSHRIDTRLIHAGEPEKMTLPTLWAVMDRHYLLIGQAVMMILQQCRVSSGYPQAIVNFRVPSALLIKGPRKKFHILLVCRPAHGVTATGTHLVVLFISVTPTPHVARIG